MNFSQKSSVFKKALISLQTITLSTYFFAFLSPVSAGAVVTTLYVDKNNVSCTDAGSGTQTQPYCTIQKGASVAVAGQTVQVAAGTYAENVTPANSGTSTSPIVFTAASGATVTVTGTAAGSS